MPQHSWFAWLLVIACFWLFQGCRSATPPAKADSPRSPYKRVVVFPFQNMAKIFGSDQTVQGPLSGKIFETGTVPDGAAKHMTAETTRILSRKNGVAAIVPSWQEVNSLGMMPWSRPRPRLIVDLQRVGLDHGADAVMVGFLYEFKERVGGDYGVDAAARVVFELNLIRVKDGRLVWHDHFAETQETLSENLLHIGKFIQRKGRWVTAEEMATQALESMIAKAFAF